MSDLPYAHVAHRGRERLVKELAKFVGVCPNLCEVIEQQQGGGQRVYTGEQTQVPELNQKLNVFCKQALEMNKICCFKKALESCIFNLAAMTNKHLLGKLVGFPALEDGRLLDHLREKDSR